MRRFRASMITMSAIACAAWGPAANAVTSISSSSYGLDANLTVLKLVTVGLGPIDQVSGVAPAAYGKSATVASLSDTLGLVLGNQALGTGLIVSSASSPFPGAPTGTATDTVNNLTSSLNALFGPAFLDLSATTVTSTSSVNGLGSLTAIGSSQIEGLKVTGSALQGATINGALFVNPAPNTVLFNLGGLEILLNEQIPSGDGVTSEAIQTNAIDIIFNNFAFSTGLLSGNIVVAHSQAGIFGSASPAVPEPATWIELLVGFGIVGAVSRRRVLKAA